MKYKSFFFYTFGLLSLWFERLLGRCCRHASATSLGLRDDSSTLQAKYIHVAAICYKYWNRRRKMGHSKINVKNNNNERSVRSMWVVFYVWHIHTQLLLTNHLSNYFPLFNIKKKPTSYLWLLNDSREKNRWKYTIAVLMVNCGLFITKYTY